MVKMLSLSGTDLGWWEIHCKQNEPSFIFTNNCIGKLWFFADKEPADHLLHTYTSTCKAKPCPALSVDNVNPTKLILENVLHAWICKRVTKLISLGFKKLQWNFINRTTSRTKNVGPNNKVALLMRLESTSELCLGST